MVPTKYQQHVEDWLAYSGRRKLGALWLTGVRVRPYLQLQDPLCVVCVGSRRCISFLSAHPTDPIQTGLWVGAAHRLVLFWCLLPAACCQSGADDEREERLEARQGRPTMRCDAMRRRTAAAALASLAPFPLKRFPIHFITFVNINKCIQVRVVGTTRNNRQICCISCLCRCRAVRPCLFPFLPRRPLQFALALARTVSDDIGCCYFTRIGLKKKRNLKTLRRHHAYQKKTARQNNHGFYILNLEEERCQITST